MRERRCLFVVTHYCPLVGGGQSVYDAYARQRPDLFQVLTSSRDYSTGQEVVGYKAFDAKVPYKITRMSQTRPDIATGTPSFPEKIRGYLRSRKIKKKLVSTILTICEQDNIDIICVGAAEAFTWLPEALRKQTRRKIVYYAHGEEFSQRAHSSKADVQRKQALQFSHGIVAVSSFTKGFLINHYGAVPDRVRLINNGVDFETFAEPVENSISTDTKQKTQKLQVVAAGRMVERKGFDRLIDAWPTVLKAAPNVVLKLAGKGPIYGAIKGKIEKLGLDETVQQLGFVPDEQLIKLYQDADLFVMPNRTLEDGDTEGFGLVFLEAAAAGTTSVGGRAGGVTDAIIDGKTGFLVDGQKTDEIATAIIKLLLDEELREKLADNAKAHAQGCDWKYKAAELITFFDELCDNSSNVGVGRLTDG